MLPVNQKNIKVTFSVFLFFMDMFVLPLLTLDIFIYWRVKVVLRSTEWRRYVSIRNFDLGQNFDFVLEIHRKVATRENFVTTRLFVFTALEE